MGEEEFERASKKVEDLYTRMDNATIRKVYAYYKQATEGDISGKRPSAIRFRERIKFDAWSSISGMSSEDARAAYIDLVNNLKLTDEAISCETREEQSRSN